MTGIYKQVLSDGRIVYTDSPRGQGSIQAIKPGQSAEPEKTQAQRDHEVAAAAIKKAPSIIPTVEQYLAYVDYLRHHSPARLDRVMRELKVVDPQTWLKLQKHPQFKSLHNTVTGLKAGEKHLTAAIGFASGDFSGAGKGWLERSLKDLMKRDRFGPFAELAEKAAATTKPTNPAMAADLAYNAKAGAAADAGLKASKAAMRSGGATVVSRVGGTFLGFFTEALKPENASNTAVLAYVYRRNELIKRGVLLDEDQWKTQELLSQGKYPELKAYMDDAVQRYIRGR